MEQKIIKHLKNLIEHGGFLNDNIHLVGFEYKFVKIELVEAQNAWLKSVGKFILKYSLSYMNEFHYILFNRRRDIKELQEEIIKLLKDIQIEDNFQVEELQDNKRKIIINTNINNTNHQTQEQLQESIISIFKRAISEDITGKQLNEIKTILEKYKAEPEKAHSEIFHKLKSFGSDVASNIVANIIANPSVWGVF